MSQTQTEALLEAWSKRLANEGRLIEAGWIGLRKMVVSNDVPQAQIDGMRMAFMAGAQHLFSSIMVVMDPEEEPTDADMHRMDLIDQELRTFVAEMEVHAGKGMDA